LKTFWLAFHAAYRCAESGACCSSGWEIPMEASRTAAVDRAIAGRAIDAPQRWLRMVGNAPDDVGGVLAMNEGRCVFHRNPGCAVHHALGPDALPSACQHFPRVCLIDPRGVFVTLSHYCPTAAAMLFHGGDPAAIVEGPAALPSGALPEGLDARESLPPSLGPRKLMDLETYAAWEERMVTVLTTKFPAEAAIMELGSDPIAAPVSLFQNARRAVPPPHSWPDAIDASREQWAQLDAGLRPFDHAIGRFLAAHAFASWMAYQGNGVPAMIRYLRTVSSVLRMETMRHVARRGGTVDQESVMTGIRQSDLLLRHLADREALASAMSA
jgi:hypothetical protein